MEKGFFFRHLYSSEFNIILTRRTGYNRVRKIAMPKILIVDDDPTITTLLNRFLSVNGYHVTALNDSSQALRTAGEDHPDLFILDIMMPPPDGFALCRMLREDPRFSKTPILIITAMDRSNSQATILGANDYLSKPFDLDELIVRIENLLGNSQG
jgi:DNA-binding response OmpR family regulator